MMDGVTGAAAAAIAQRAVEDRFASWLIPGSGAKDRGLPEGAAEGKRGACSRCRTP